MGGRRSPSVWSGSWSRWGPTEMCGDTNLWNGGTTRVEGHRLRLRRPDPRHRRTDLPLVARGLRGARPGAAFRPLDADRRLLERGVRPARQPRRTTWPRADAGRARAAGAAAQRACAGAGGPARRRGAGGVGPRHRLEDGRRLELDPGL